MECQGKHKIEKEMKTNECKLNTNGENETCVKKRLRQREMRKETRYENVGRIYKGLKK